MRRQGSGAVSHTSLKKREGNLEWRDAIEEREGSRKRVKGREGRGKLEREWKRSLRERRKGADIPQMQEPVQPCCKPARERTQAVVP